MHETLTSGCTQIYCIRGAAEALHVQPLQGRTDTCEVVSDKSKHIVNSNTKYQIRSYSLFACHMMLTTSILTLLQLMQQLFQTIHKTLDFLSIHNFGQEVCFIPVLSSTLLECKAKAGPGTGTKSSTPSIFQNAFSPMATFNTAKVPTGYLICLICLI